MNKMLALLILTFNLITIAVFADETKNLQNQETIYLSIPSMNCPVCPVTIKRALMKVAGVHNVTVDFKSKIATIVFNKEKTNSKILIETTKNAGYPSTLKKINKQKVVDFNRVNK